MRKSTDNGRGATNGIPNAPRPGRDAESLGLDVRAASLGASPDGVLILDGDGRVMYASPAYCELFGLQADRLRGQDILRFIPERHWQTVLSHWADVRDGRSEPLLGVARQADGSELEFEVRGTVWHLQGRRFLALVFRDMTQRHRQTRQAAALAQAAASVAASESIDAILEAISKCALAGTRALAAWVKVDDEHHVARWVGAAGVPDGFREHLRSAASAACARFVDQEAMAAPVVVYADWRQQLERGLGMTCSLNLPWQAAAIARLLYRGAAVGLLTAIYREG